jgi:LPXTG-motif cell wall-anchored protein
MEEQYRMAQEHGVRFYETAEEVEEALRAGELVYMPGSEDYEVADFVQPPYVRPDVLPFIERTARLYREACREPLVVTSAVRPRQDQPPNAHELSVHPAGMAVDFRVSRNPECVAWFEEKLLELEEEGLVQATRERNPPHFHIAVYPRPYLAYAWANPLPESLAERAPAGTGTGDSAASISAAIGGLAAATLLAGAAWVIWRRGRRRIS